MLCTVRKTSMNNQTWRDLVYLKKYKRVLAEENRKWKDLREIAERKVDEDEAVDNMMKEKQDSVVNKLKMSRVLACSKSLESRKTTTFPGLMGT